MKEVLQFAGDVRFSWRALLASKIFRAHLLLTIVIFCVVGYYCSLYISMWETRKGTMLIDPLLNFLTPRDFSFSIFCIVHSSFLISVLLNMDNPKELLKGFQAYAFLLLVRTICIYLIPLEAPAGMIYLDDPFTAILLNNVNVVTKDLFFSGHISAMFLFIYFAKKKPWRTYLMFATPVLAGMILWQHVHYTVDIIAAPFFAVACCKLIDIMHDRWEYGINRIRLRKAHY